MKDEEDFVKRVEYMEHYIPVLSCENCTIITSFLTIFGRLQPFQLLEKTGIPKKSLYRALGKLLGSNIIKKIGEMDQNDKKRIFYILNEFQLIDPEFDEDFIIYLIKSNKFKLFSEWYSKTNEASIGFIKAVSKIIETNIQRKFENKEKIDKPLENGLFIELAFSCPDVRKLKIKLVEFLKNEIRPLVKDFDTTFINPIKNPTALYISLVPLN